VATAKLLIFAGSARTLSFNKKLARIAADAVHRSGAEVTYLDLRDYALPIYDGDLESAEGLPVTALVLRRLFREHDGFVIASPEYNASLSPLLKNTIDWVSRRAEDGDYKDFFQNKSAALLATSPGASGGARGLPALRQVLAHLGVQVLEHQVSIPRQTEAFAEDGSLTNFAQRAEVDALVQLLLKNIAQQRARRDEAVERSGSAAGRIQAG